MNKALKLLLVAVTGGILYYGLKGKRKQSNNYIIFLNSELFGDSTLTFGMDYNKALQIYHKLSKSKKVVYQDIVNYDSDENELYEKNKAKKKWHKLKDVSQIFSITLENNGEDLQKVSFVK